MAILNRNRGKGGKAERLERRTKRTIRWFVLMKERERRNLDKGPIIEKMRNRVREYKI